MSIAHRAAIAAAFFLSACGGGGGGDAPAPPPPPPPPPPAAVAPAEALRLTAQAVMDVTELAWALSFDAQLAVVAAPSTSIATTDCPQGGRSLITRPTASLLRTESQNCGSGDVRSNGVVEVEGATVSSVAEGSSWAGTVRWVAFGVADSSRGQLVSATATAAGFVESVFGPRTRGQPMTMQLSALAATRTPDALGRNATLTSPLLRVERIPAEVALSRDLYALEGCVTITAPGLDAELCIDTGSRIALLENIGSEQLTGRLRWNASSPTGFDARLRVTPVGAPGSTALRIELDLDRDGSFEASATLDRNTDIGLRI